MKDLLNNKLTQWIIGVGILVVAWAFDLITFSGAIFILIAVAIGTYIRSGRNKK